jgi:hypothetical protein
MLCPLPVSANNNNWPAPGRRGYILDSVGETSSPYNRNTIGARDDIATGGGPPAGSVSLILVWYRRVIGACGRLGKDADDGAKCECDTAVEGPLPRVFPNHF